MASKIHLQIVYIDSDGAKANGPLIVVDPTPKRRRIRTFDDASWTVDQTTKRFRRYLLRKDAPGLEATIRALDRLDCWSEALRGLTSGPSPNPAKGHALISFWILHGLSSVPAGLRENLPVPIDVLRLLLTPYGGVGLTLYRGELESRYAKGVIGIAWTPILERAKMFAHRRVPLNDGQGVVLKIEATPEMIIAALRDVTEHTVNIGEDEYLVDPRLIKGKVSVVL